MQEPRRDAARSAEASTAAQADADADALVGRDRELELISAFLHRATKIGEALLVRGEPGVGKTVLLDAAVQEATERGTLVLRAWGVQFEAEIAFSGLRQALLPLYQEFPRLSAAHQEALNVALGLGGSVAPDRLLVSNATLSLLSSVASERPVLAVIDDIPWLDRASAGVLGFVARRVAGTRVGFLGASRTGEGSFFDRAGLPEHELAPLDEAAADELMRSRYPALAAFVRDRLLREAQGNPLAVLELPAALSGSQAAALETLPEVLPLSRRLEELFASKVAQLSPGARRLLLLTALDGTGDLRVLAAGGDWESGLGELTSAEQAGLAYIDEPTHRVAFRHPIIRAVVVELAGDEERREAHAALADLFVNQPDRQAWHIGEATVEPDEEVAMLLEQAAHRILRRGDGTGAVAALSRAAELSPAGSDRSRRLADAAYIGADVTGDIRSVARLLEDARRADPSLGESLSSSAAAAYVLLNGDGDVDTAHCLLAGALERQRQTGDVPGEAFYEVLHNLLEVCLYGGRPELWVPFDQAVARVRGGFPEVLELWINMMADPVRRGAGAVGQLAAAIGALATEADPSRIERIATAAVFVDGVSGCREALWRVVRDGREGGAVASAINSLMLLGLEDFQSGRWDEVPSLTDEGLKLCEQHGYLLLTWPLLYCRAQLAAAIGDGETAAALADRMQGWAAPRGVRAVQWYASHAMTLAALGRGDAEDAYQHAATITAPGSVDNHFGQTLWVALDLVEAAARAGRQREAAAHVAALRKAGVSRLSSRLAFLVAAAAAIAEPETGTDLFDQALSIPGADRWPLDVARVQLYHGERLRRRQQTEESRSQLTAAMETFQRIGARPWADRAAGELRATGQTGPSPLGAARELAPGHHEPLSTQELEIATLAAGGLSNKEIAARLFMSHRTVGGHLYRIFPKLGITSRAALRDALMTQVRASRVDRDCPGAEPSR